MTGQTILLVDDDIAVLAALSKLLGHFGYVVAGASNPQAAMNYVTSSRKCFDLIVTDLAMPGIGGVEFMEMVKKTFPNVPVIVMTGHTEQCTIDEAMRCGASAYLTKPFETPYFISTIERALHPPRRATAQTF
jgi:DNA-binding NtrC family response regulator